MAGFYVRDEVFCLADLGFVPDDYRIVDVETAIPYFGDTTMASAVSSDRVVLEYPNVVDLCWLDTVCR